MCVRSGVKKWSPWFPPEQATETCSRGNCRCPLEPGWDVEGVSCLDILSTVGEAARGSAQVLRPPPRGSGLALGQMAHVCDAWHTMGGQEHISVKASRSPRSQNWDPHQ